MPYMDMITHGSQYQLLRSLQSIDELSAQLDKDDHLKVVREQLKKNIKSAKQTLHSIGRESKLYAQYNLLSRPIECKVGQEVWRRNFIQSNFNKGISDRLCA